MKTYCFDEAPPLYIAMDTDPFQPLSDTFYAHVGLYLLNEEKKFNRPF